MNNNLELKEVLAAIDLDSKSLWNELSDSQKKSIKFVPLNRYISSVQGSREHKEHYLVVGNERYNKHLFSIVNKHPNLAWQLACSCSFDQRKVMHHEWIKVNSEKDKKITFLSELFPNMKWNDLETLSKITTDKEIKQYCENLGWDKKQVNGIKL
jgi:hypothetical protein